MTPDETFKTSFQDLCKRLVKLREDTTRWSAPQVLRMVSQRQAKPAANALAAWAEAGAPGQPDLDEPSLRAAIYDVSRIAQQMTAFPRVSALAVSELASSVLDATSRASMLTGMMALRSLTERIALATWLSREMEAFRTSNSPAFSDLLNHGEHVTRALYGSGVSWIVLGEADLTTLKPKDAAYVQLEDSASMERVHVLKAVDLLAKTVPGARVAYDVLCDFLHPNVGDLLSMTREAKSFTDGRGTRHVERHLGAGGDVFLGSRDVQSVMAQVFGIVSEIILSYPPVLAALDETASVAERVMRQSAHRALRKQKHLFDRSDPCPCLSGKPVRLCGARR